MRSVQKQPRAACQAATKRTDLRGEGWEEAAAGAWAGGLPWAWLLAQRRGAFSVELAVRLGLLKEHGEELSQEIDLGLEGALYALDLEA